MKIKILIFCSLFFSTFLLAQKQTPPKPKSCKECITAYDAAYHVGDTIKVYGKVIEVKYVDWEKGQPYFINLDQSFPNIDFNVVIFKDAQPKFENIRDFKNKKIIVSGFVKTHHYNGNTKYPPTDYPEIVVSDPSQIEIYTK